MHAIGLHPSDFEFIESCRIALPRLFIIDGAKALSKAIRRTFGRTAAIQRCQVHKARNIMERLPKPAAGSSRPAHSSEHRFAT
jgi:hypothetical protein